MLVNDIVRKEYYDNKLIRTFEELLENTNRIESLFRNSREYKNYIAGIKEGLQIKNCAFFVDKNFDDLSLELHHQCPTLYNIVVLVGSKMLTNLEEGEFLTVYQIVDEVIKFHMKDYPTIVMLSKTIHELYHSGQYVIPTKTNTLHLGKYKDFINEYFPYLVESDLDGLVYFLNTKESDEIIEWLKEKRS